MIKFEIPGERNFIIEHVVLDFNGTIAVDGTIIKGVTELLNQISQCLQVHIITADTHNTVMQYQEKIPATIVVLNGDNTSKAKLEYIEKLNPEKVIAIGNGKNDALMLKQAAIGIALIQSEGASSAAIQSADITCFDIKDALQMVLNTKRIIATLRN